MEVLILRRYFFLQPVIAVVANRLRRAYRPGAVEIVVVDRDGDHVYQPGCCSSRSAWPKRGG